MNQHQIMRKIEDLLNEHSHRNDSTRYYVAAETLNQCITWRNTPQGHEYWSNIRDELMALSRKAGDGNSDSNGEQSATGTGKAITVAALLARIEQDLLDVKATLEAESAKPEQAKKLVQFMRHALHRLEGREALGQRGLLEDLKDWS